ncbi:MAG TPA: hypothetical protein VKZ44_03940, partial [Taishania sp.]|nr:hypothetical protein [Taishania sp.]
CGKLKCCLNYELDSYLEALKSFPKADVKLHTEKGTAYHIKTDVFKRQMWFGYSGEAAIGGLVMLDPDRVKEIIAMNKEGVKPQDLAEFASKVEVEVVTDYENVVGQDSVNRFEHVFKAKKKKKKNPSNGGDAKAKQPKQGNQQVKTHENVSKKTQPVAQQKPQGQESKAEGTKPKRPNNKRRNPNRNRGNQPNATPKTEN